MDNERHALDGNKPITELTDEQQKHLASINWLVSGAVGSGRSTVLAFAFLKKGMRHRGQPVHVFDHNTNRCNRDYVLNKVLELAADAGVKVRVNRLYHSFVVMGDENAGTDRIS
jgi:hypothetical protein